MNNGKIAIVCNGERVDKLAKIPFIGKYFRNIGGIKPLPESALETINLRETGTTTKVNTNTLAKNQTSEALAVGEYTANAVAQKTKDAAKGFEKSMNKNSAVMMHASTNIINSVNSTNSSVVSGGGGGGGGGSTSSSGDAYAEKVAMCDI